ncbi:MAG: hypothetical protein Q7S74_05320 [Nanoarchaeota archaeon]|nr:hypothetical protein [Nanoarchaeota archaeon]
MNINITSSSIFTYLLFLIILTILVSTIYYIIKKKKNIKDIKINPFAPIFGLLFLIGLWLADLTTLDMGVNGLEAMVGLNPVSSSRVPAPFVWCVAILAMFFINYFFLKINTRKENKKIYSFNKILIYTQLLGLIVFVISAIAMAIFGYEATFLGFYLLNLYHSTLPLIILTIFILVVDIK